MIRSIIVEDQPPAQRILKKYIDDTAGISLEGTFSDPIEAITFLKNQNIDLIFLDVHLPKLSGIDFLKIIPKPTQVIFTTAFEKYALDAYELDVIDYLLKPFSYARFLKGVEKAKSYGFSPTNTKTEGEHLFVKNGHNYTQVNFNTILYIRAEGDYTELHQENERLVTNNSIKYWEEQLVNRNFFRIHKSYMVNVNHIQAVSGNVIRLTNQAEIPIGRKYKEDFHSRFLS